MKFSSSSVASALLWVSVSTSYSSAFVPSKHQHVNVVRDDVRKKHNHNFVPAKVTMVGTPETSDSTTTEGSTTTTTTTSPNESLTNDIISKLRYRDIVKELEQRDLDTSGTLSDMKDRLRQVTMIDGEAMTTKNKNADETYDIDKEALDKVCLSFFCVFMLYQFFLRVNILS